MEGRVIGNKLRAFRHELELPFLALETCRKTLGKPTDVIPAEAYSRFSDTLLTENGQR